MGPAAYTATYRYGGAAVSPSLTFRVGPSIRATPASVAAGQSVQVSGLAGGCPAGDQVTLISRAFSHAHEFAGVSAVFATVRSDDRYAVRTRIPAGRRPGTYSITARCGGGSFGVSRVAARAIALRSTARMEFGAASHYQCRQVRIPTLEAALSAETDSTATLEEVPATSLAERAVADLLPDRCSRP